MDFPLTKAVELNLEAGRYKDRAGGAAGSLITGQEFLNPVLDELIALQTAAGLTADETKFTQVRDAVQILSRGGALGFRVKPQNPLALSVDIEAGAFFDRATGLLVSVAATNAGPITAPAANPRNDIVYIDALTGAVGIATGAENVAPVDPALPAGKLPVKRIKAYVGMTVIDAVDLEELRYLGSAGTGAAALVKFYESAEQTITFNSGITLAHGLGAEPGFVTMHLVCKTAEFAFSVGDKVVYPTNGGGPTAEADGVLLRIDSTNIRVFFGNLVGAFYHIRTDTGGKVLLSAANWKLVLRAWA